MHFLGEYEITLDAKGRFMFPTSYRKQWEGVRAQKDESLAFVMKRGIEPCITLVPMAKWLSLMARLQTLNDFDPQVRDFKRKFLSGAVEVTPDAAGRILIPKNLIAYASLQKNLVISALGGELEIWDSERYKQQYASYDPSAFSALAARVMGEMKE